MKDSQQMSVDISSQNNMALKTLSAVSLKDTNIFPGDVIDKDDLPDENFHLHLSEDDDEEKNEKKEDTATANGTTENFQETEDDILNKFVAPDGEEPLTNGCLENEDEKLEEELLNEASDGKDETGLTNGDCAATSNNKNNSRENNSVTDDNTSTGDNLTSLVSENNKTNSEPSANNSENETEKLDQTSKSQDQGDQDAQDAQEAQEKVNADLLKDQIMDTEHLLQIVDQADSEENNDKDSCSGNSETTADKGESEDNEMEGNETETDKNDNDDEEDDNEASKIDKDDDGVEIEEDSLYKADSDSELDKEYAKFVNEKDSAENATTDDTSVEKIESDEKNDASVEKTAASDEEKNVDAPADKKKSSEDAGDASFEVTDSTEKKKEEKTSVADEEIPMETEVVEIATENKEKKIVVENEKEVSDSTESDASSKEVNLEMSAELVADKVVGDVSSTDSIPKSAKRTLSDSEIHSEAKKLRLEDETASSEESTPTKEKESEETPESLNVISEYMQKKNLRKLTRRDLEQICLLKMCEAICHKSEIGELRHQLGVQEQMVDMWRKEAAQLTKQARDLEIVNKRLLHEVRLKNDRDKPLIPVKITRSVGLQVRSDNNVMNNVIGQKRRFTRPQPPVSNVPAKQNRFNQVAKPVATSPNTNKTMPNKAIGTPVSKPQMQTPTKIKTIPAKSPSLLSKALQNSTAQALAANASPGVTNTSSHSSVNSSTAPPLTSLSNTPSTPSSNSTSATNKSNISPKTPKNTPESKTFIDLTDEDDKKPTSTPTPTSLTSSTQGVRIVSAPVKSTNVGSSPAVVNPPRIMYVYNNQLHQGLLATDSSKLGPQKLMLKLNSNVIGQANGVLTAVSNGSTLTVSNATIRTNQMQPVRISAPVTSVRTSPAVKPAMKHPAPLPPPPMTQISLTARKPIPPKPHLSIRRSSGGIVLSWKMPYNLDNYEPIASYQLYAYQETTSPPSSDMWRKVGDVKALALPMACTLTQFADGNKYHFAVRAVDVQKRMGPFSEPEQILL